MTFHIRAHFDGRVLVPDEPVDLPLNHPLEVEVAPCAANGTTNGQNPVPSVTASGLSSPTFIQERLRRLEGLNGLIPGPVIPLEALRRENLYDELA